MWKYVSAKFLCLCFAICGLVTGFYLYEDLRSAEFGFDLKALLVGLCVACLLPSLFALPTLLLVSALSAMEEGTEWRAKWRKNRLLLFALMVGIFEGSLCAECYSTLDEKAFKAEVAHRHTKYARDRRGVGGGSLWFSTKDGFSASSYSVAVLKDYGSTLGDAE